MKSWFIVLSVFVSFSVVRAEYSVPESMRSDDIETIDRLVFVYSAFMQKMQKVRFRYAGKASRSVPTVGIVAVWEHAGNVCIDAEMKSVHLDSSIIRVATDGQSTGKKSIVTEALVGPGTCLSLLSDSGRLRTLSSGSWTVASQRDLPGDCWVDALCKHELACLFGVQTTGTKCHTYWELLKTGRRSLTSRRDNDGLLRVVRIEEVDVFLELLFRTDQSGAATELLAIEECCTAESIDTKSIDELTRVRLDFFDSLALQFEEFQVKVTIDRKGGILERSKRENAIIKTAQTLEPATWTYDYLITEISNNDLNGCFVLKNDIPNGTRVRMKDDSLAYVWEDGRVISDVPMGVRNMAHGSRFQGGTFRIWWIAANVGGLLLLALVLVLIRRCRHE